MNNLSKAHSWSKVFSAAAEVRKGLRDTLGAVIVHIAACKVEADAPDLA